VEQGFVAGGLPIERSLLKAGLSSSSVLEFCLLERCEESLLCLGNGLGVERGDVGSGLGLLRGAFRLRCQELVIAWGVGIALSDGRCDAGSACVYRGRGPGCGSMRGLGWRMACAMRGKPFPNLAAKRLARGGRVCGCVGVASGRGDRIAGRIGNGLVE
jgi:hypothetical protein